MDSKIVLVKENADRLLKQVNKLQIILTDIKHIMEYLQEETNEAYKKMLAETKDEQLLEKNVDLFPDRYSRENEGRKVHKKLVKQGIISANFESTYFGYFKSKNDFGFFKLYGTNNRCGIPGTHYQDYAEELFDERFIFVEGHVFIK